jgi:hypothetical protein
MYIWWNNHNQHPYVSAVNAAAAAAAAVAAFIALVRAVPPKLTVCRFLPPFIFFGSSSTDFIACNSAVGFGTSEAHFMIVKEPKLTAVLLHFLGYINMT